MTDPFVEMPIPPSQRPPRPTRSGAPVILGGLAILLVAAFGAWWLARARSNGAQAEATTRTSEVAAGPVVRTEAVSAAKPERIVVLLGEARPYASVTLFAKVSGYLKHVSVDRGDKVRAGSVLAEIDAPETERALQAATSDANNKAAIAGRVEQLLAKKFVSPQEADQARADASIAHERMRALQEEMAYATIRAPFDGVVTARFADPGALMQNAGSSQTSALPVVSIARVDRLRVLLYLDQREASSVHAGTPVTIIADEGGAAVQATVTRVGGEIDPRTRKLLAEVELDNASGRIVPGSFVRAELRIATASDPEIPVEALIVKRSKSFVAVLAADSTVHLHAVTVLENDGAHVTIKGDVAVGQQVVLNLGDALADGSRVRPLPTTSVPAVASPSATTGAKKP